jgi:hypothetical protein
MDNYENCHNYRTDRNADPFRRDFFPPNTRGIQLLVYLRQVVSLTPFVPRLDKAIGE